MGQTGRNRPTCSRSCQAALRRPGWNSVAHYGRVCGSDACVGARPVGLLGSGCSRLAYSTERLLW